MYVPVEMTSETGDVQVVPGLVVVTLQVRGVARFANVVCP
jgi:hypothetical protein